MQAPSRKGGLEADRSHETAGEEGAQEVARRLVADLALQPRLAGDRVERRRLRVDPGRLRVERRGERIELGDPVCVRPSRGVGERCVVPLVADRGTVLADVHVAAAAMAREELDAELGQQGQQLGLVRRDPLGAELVRLAADLDVEDAPADAVTRLEHDHVTSLSDE